MFRLLSAVWFCSSLLAAPQSLSFSAYPSTLTLSAAAGSAPTIEPIVVAPPDVFTAWKASVSAPWLSLSSTSGVGPSTITATADTSGMTPGVYSGAVRLQSSGASAAAVIVTLRIGLPPGGAPGAEWHVTSDGSPAGDGTPVNAWDLATALSAPPQVQPGDTIWLHAGKYGSGSFDAIIGSRLVGTKTAPILVRAWPGDRVVIDAWLQVGCCDGAGDPAKGAYTWFWGLEFASFNPDRRSASSGPPDFAKQANHAAVDVWAPGTKIVNCIVHDTSAGIEMWSEATDSEAYGNLVYNVGGYGPDRGHGHGFYLQNPGPAFKRIVDNITFNNFGEGLQVYGSSDAYVRNFHLEGNVSFNNGAIGTGSNSANGTAPAGSRDDNLIIGDGKDGPSGIVLINNFTYHTPLADDGYNELGFPATSRSGDLTALGNYFIGGIEAVDLFRWDSAVFRENTIYSANRIETALAWRDDQNPAGYAYDFNHYYGSGNFTVAAGCNVSPCPERQRAVTFDDWRAASGVDLASTFQPGRPTGVWTSVRPNLFEPGRANIIVYNWDLFATVAVDLSQAGIPIGNAFEIRDAENWFAPPIASGIYYGGLVTLPMNGLQAALPNGTVPNAQPHTAPEFGVFIAVSHPPPVL